MAVNFPTSPAVNDTHTSGATTWRWDGTRWGKVTDDAAGGVLSGTYPNPSFASDMATQAEIRRYQFPPAYRAMEARSTYYPPGSDPNDQ